MILYSLWHEDEHGDNGKIIGIFVHREDADRVLAELSGKPGFRDYPDGFTIDREKMDQDFGWTEGFLGHEGTADYDEWEWK